MELPRLEPLWQTYKERGFQLVAVETQQDQERAKTFIQEENLSFLILENGKGEKEVAESLYGVYAVPTTFLINKEGRIVYFSLGFEEGDEVKLEKQIQELLEDLKEG